MKQSDKLNWLKLLNDKRSKQCYNKIQDISENSYCAIGLLLKAMNLNCKDFVLNVMKTGLTVQEQITLAKMNDLDRLTFSQIADYVYTNITGE